MRRIEKSVVAKRFLATRVMRLPAGPAAVFPLLCPVREYEWIPHWDCELLHCPSGAAERDCVFATSYPDFGAETWICTRHEPPRCVEYVRFSEAGLLTRLTLTLAPCPEDETFLLWEIASMAARPAAVPVLAALAGTGYEAQLDTLEDLLTRHLTGGTD